MPQSVSQTINTGASVEKKKKKRPDTFKNFDSRHGTEEDKDAAHYNTGTGIHTNHAYDS